jgi:FkbM family methyltransferase
MALIKKIIIKLLKLTKTYKGVKVSRGRVEEYVHHKKTLSFYSHFIRKGDLCFDVGANIGDKTKIFLELGAKVIVIEPEERSLRCLGERYRDNKKVVIVPKALGEKEGEAEMMISEAHNLSSLSKDWVDSVVASGRFSDKKWPKKRAVSMTTLDKVIGEFGMPVFCKIDAEGYEYEVFKGLSYPIKFISFEFTPERMEESKKCINYLSGLGSVSFNYSFEDSMGFALSNWVGPKEMCGFLLSQPVKSDFSFIWGDVYAKFSG